MAEDEQTQEMIEKAFLLLPPRLNVMVSTAGKDGSINVAPYCEFAKLYGNYMVIGMDKQRDSLKNIKETKECVIALLSLEHVKKISMAGKPYSYGVSEFEKTGLTPEKASKVKAPLVKEALVNYECVLHNTMDFDGSTAVIVRIIDAHFDEGLIKDDDEIKTRMSSRAAFHVSKGRVFWAIGEKDAVDTGIDHKVI
jgi:flavin reductase (DIM6/NTAB) family NADH-FMN oxidoreductase RutF